jgi:hypothetical protein
MADNSAIYTLTTPGGTIIFNNGDLKDGTDKFWIQIIHGLEGAPLRTPIDNAPHTDGGLVHPFLRAARPVIIEGVFVTESVGFPSVGDACTQLQNEMEDDLLAALESIVAADGTLAWTPLGLSARSLTVRNNQPLETTPGENYAIRNFVFGVIASDPAW